MNNVRAKVVSFFSFIIEFSLQLETQLHVNEFFLIAFTTLGALLPQSYAIIPKYIESKNTSFYYFAAKIVRPNLFLPQSEYVYTISLLVIASMIFLKYLLVFNFFTKQQDQLKQNRIFKVITFLNQIYDVWLVNPILELILFSSTGWMALPLLIYVSFWIFRIIITKSQVFFQQDNFNLSNTSILMYLIQILNFAQILLFRDNEYLLGNHTFYTMILGLLINIFSIANTMFYSPYLNSKISNIVLAIHANSFIYSFCCLICLRTDFAIEQIEIFAIIILPCYFKVAEYYCLNTLLLTIIEQNNPYRLVYLILYLQQSITYSTKRVLIEAIVSRNHVKHQVSILKAENQDDLLAFYLSISVKHQELSKKNLIAHLSLLLRLKLYFQAYICISRENSSKQSSFLNKIKFQICANKCREKLNYHMMAKNNIDQAQETDMNVEKFMEMETMNLDLFKRIAKLVSQKICFLKSFQSDHIDKLYYDSSHLISELESLLKHSKAFYQLYPTHKIQNVIAFIYAELLNDYISAHKTISLGGLEDDTIFKSETDTKLDLYSAKTSYIIINLDDYQVVRCSSNACSFFQVDQIILNDLVPNGIREYHNYMIENFIKTGKSKFFRNVEEGLYIQNGYTEGVSMSTEILFQQHQLHALMILSVQEEDQIIMVVDKNYKIVGLSAEFFQIVGGKPHQIELIYEIPVNYVIPKFKQYAQDSDSIQHLEIRFLTTEFLFDFVSSLIQQKGKKNITELMDYYWLDNAKYDIFRTHCKISNNNERYFIVRFNYLKNQNQSNSMSRIMTQKTMKTMVNLINSETQFDELIEKSLPYDEIKSKKVATAQMKRQIDVQQSSERLFSNRESGTVEGCQLLDDQAKSQFYKSSYNAADYTQNQMVSIKQIKQQVYYHKNNEQESVSKDEQESQEGDIEGQSSQKSSMARQNKSIFYKKYVLVEKMIHSQNTNQVMKIFIMMVLLQSLILILQAILSLVSTKDTFTSYLTNIDLLQIKYYLFSPLESFIVTRYTIINYNAQYTAKTITSKQLKNYLIYPNSNLNLGFDDVQNNLAEILNRLTLQDFLAGQYEIYIYTDTNVGYLYNITMRQTLSILVNYQYTFKAAYIYDGKTVSDSPYIYYSYRNLLTLYDAFDSLNQQLYQQNILQIDSDKDKELKLFYPFIIVIMILIALQMLWFMKSQSKISALIGLMTLIEPYRMQKDIERLTIIADDINRHHDHLFKYQFSLDRKEGQLLLQQKLFGTQPSKRLEYKKQNISNKKGIFLIFIQLSLIMGFTIAKYSINLNYFIKFGPTAYFYQSITDLGTNVPTIYAMREVLYYRWRYPFYTTNDTTSIMQQIQTCLSHIQTTTSFIQTLQNENYLFSQEFFTNLSEIESSDICNLLTPEMYDKSKSLCGITMAGSFLHGLTGSLIYIYQSIYTEMSINQFLNKTQDTVQELEGAFIMSQVIQELNTNMKNDLTSQTNNVIQTVTIICIIAILFAIISQLVLCLMIQPFLQKQYYMAKRFLYLIPQSTLFLDDVFERVARSVMQDQQIIH